MSQLITTTDLSPSFISALSRLCYTPFTLELVTLTCEGNGWEIIPPDEWETEGAPFLRVKTPHSESALMALWGTEEEAGIPIAVIYEDDATIEVSNATFAEFDTLYDRAVDLCTTTLGSVTREGSYESDLRPKPFRFALFEGENSTLAILQHDVGDGHLGHAASLDIRILPTRADLIQLPPLETDLIF